VAGRVDGHRIAVLEVERRHVGEAVRALEHQAEVMVRGAHREEVEAVERREQALLQLGGERVDACGPLGGDVLQLGRIRGQVVVEPLVVRGKDDQLLAGQADRLRAGIAAEDDELGERGCRRPGRRAAHERHEARRVERRRCVDLERVEHGGQQRDRAHLFGDPPAGRGAGEPDDERHVQQLVEECVAVIEGAVVEELLAVVGHDDDERVAGAAGGSERVEQAAHEPVGMMGFGGVEVADPTAVVGRPARVDLHVRCAVHPDGRKRRAEGAIVVRRDEEARILGRRRIRCVRLEEVDEEEEAFRRGVGEPCGGALGGRARVGEHLVRLEAAIEADRRSDPGVADERGGAEAAVVQHARERRMCGVEAAHVRQLALARAVVGRQEAREHRREGRQRPRRRADRGLEEHALACERVDARRRRARIAVATEMIGPERVERDDDDVRGRRRRRGPGARGQERDGGDRTSPKRHGVSTRPDRYRDPSCSIT
jgi:hypothetical protein